MGIGDGDNEIGMGKVFAAALDCDPHGREIAGTVPADSCIAVGVSNWEAFGLVGAISVLAGSDLPPMPDECIDGVEACVRPAPSMAERIDARPRWAACRPPPAPLPAF